MSVADFATFTRDCLAFLDGDDSIIPTSGPYDPDAPTPTYDETAEFLSEWARPNVVWSSDHRATWGGDPHPLVAWLPVLGWLLFAWFVALLVWAVVS